MSIIVTKLHVSLFDVHVNLLALVKGAFHPDFYFLGFPQTYERLYRQSAVLMERDELRILPHVWAPGEEKNHFWEDFSANLPLPSLWHRHLPLRCEPQQMRLRFVLDQPAIATDVTPLALIWPWGWSSNLDFSLAGRFTLDDLQEVVASWGSYDSPERPFLNNDCRCKPALVFRDLAELTARTVYRDATVTPGSAAVARHFVLSITATEGEMPAYRKKPKGEILMDETVREKLHSVLLGRRVGIRELQSREMAEKRPFFDTWFRAGDVGLTDLGRGTVLSMARSAAKGSSEKTLWAKASNIRSAALMTMALTALAGEVEQHFAGFKNLQPLARSARDILSRMKQARYDAFRWKFATWHGANRETG